MFPYNRMTDAVRSSASQEEARSAVKQLAGVVQEVLGSNRSIARKLEALESHYALSARSTRDGKVICLLRRLFIVS